MEIPGHRGTTWERRRQNLERKPRAGWQIGDEGKGEERDLAGARVTTTDHSV